MVKLSILDPSSLLEFAGQALLRPGAGKSAAKAVVNFIHSFISDCVHQRQNSSLNARIGTSASQGFRTRGGKAKKVSSLSSARLGL